MKGFNPTHRVMAGDRLVGSVLRVGNARPESPRRFTVYWSLTADRLRPPRIECATAREACAAAMQWAKQHFNDLQVVRRIRA
jgi:hypothetical protein